MSYKAEVQTRACKPTDWTSNALRFATEQEASCYAVDLARRWTAVKRWRLVQGSDPVTARWDMLDGLVHLA